MTKSVTLPESLTFQCPVMIEAGDEAAKKVPRFRMVAYTGGMMRISGFPHPVVVDLAGLTIERQNVPVRLDHQPRQGVGHTERVAVEHGQVVAEGLVSRDTSWARDVVKSGANGFPWQASIGAAVVEAQFVPPGQSVIVNGRAFTGPVYVVRRSVLKEISFVDSGADTRTSAQIAASEKERCMTFEAWIEAKGLVLANLSEDEKTQLKAQYGAEPPRAPASAPAPAAPPAPASEPVPKNGDSQAPATPATVTAADAGADQPADAEARRVEAIRRLRDGQYPDIEARTINGKWDEETTKNHLLHVLRAGRPQVAVVTGGSRPNTPQVFEATALMASGMSRQRLEAIFHAPVLEAADRYRGVGIQEFCELAAGRQLPRFRRDASGWLEAAFSTVSLPNILSNVANKMLLEGYNYIEDAWRQIAKIASVNDFKEHSRYRMTGSFKFEQVGPDGELKHGKLDEQKYGQKADTHGIMFALTRTMIINDDLGAFTDIPRQIGMGAAEAIADAAWGLWLRNPTQTDGKAFFHADHGNYLAGADTALSIDSLTAAEIKFGAQSKPNGRPLGIPASILLVPTALKVPASVLMTAAQVNETTTANAPKPNANPHAGKYRVVSSVYLSSASFDGSSAKAWYLLADPNRLPAIEVAFLNGVDQPTVEKTDADFNTLGIQFRGYIDFGVREQDYRGALKVKGEA